MSKSTSKRGAVRHTLDKAEDAIGGVVGKAAASVSSDTNDFVAQAAIGDRYEIEAARIALERSRSDAVRQVARKMIDDHTANSHHLEAALEMNESKGVAHPPEGLDTRRSKMLEHLRTAPDDSFDATYLDQQVLAHEETVSLLGSYRDRGGNPQMRSVAEGAFGVVKRHLERVKSLRGQIA
jgi:putative membrane protein